MFDLRRVDPVNAAADPLRDPVIVAVPAHMLVAPRHLLADLNHLVGADTRVDLQVVERTVEALDMLAQLKGRAVEGPRHVERRVAEPEAAVAERNHHLVFRNVVAVEIGDALVRQGGHDGLLGWLRREV